jgi:hypothetical protein
MNLLQIYKSFFMYKQYSFIFYGKYTKNLFAFSQQ